MQPCGVGRPVGVGRGARASAGGTRVARLQYGWLRACHVSRVFVYSRTRCTYLHAAPRNHSISCTASLLPLIAPASLNSHRFAFGTHPSHSTPRSTEL